MSEMKPVRQQATGGVVSPASANVQIRGLSKSYRNRKGTVTVLNELDLDVRCGEMLVLLGPSGCGKTTLLRCIAGLEQADKGSIVLGDHIVNDAREGVFVPAHRRGIGMVFQNYALWPHMRVAANVEFPLRARGMRYAIKEGRVQEVLDIVQCGHLADRFPPQLSGGQQQRVSLARALAPQPDVLLMDEPLSNLDALLRVDLRAQLRQLHQTLGYTGIYVTHDQVEAMSIGTRVVVMRAGRIEQDGHPEDIYAEPANEYVAEFLGMRNALDGEVSGGNRLSVCGTVAHLSGAELAPGGYRLRARSSDLRLRPAGAPTDGGADTIWLQGGRVIDRAPSGETVDFLIEIDGSMCRVEAREHVALTIGETVQLGLAADRVRVYDARGNLTAVQPISAARG
jgi:iron(III) transport system ATP-binding protein